MQAENLEVLVDELLTELEHKALRFTNYISAEEGAARFAERAEQIISAVGSAVAAELAIAFLATHERPVVRLLSVDVARLWLPSTFATDALFGLATDSDDVVCLRAIEVAGDERISALAPYIVSIVGKPSRAVHSSVSPVGRGAAFGLSSLQKLFNAKDPRGLASAEHHLLSDPATQERLDLAPLEALTSDKMNAELAALGAPETMVLVPAGRSVFGLNPEQVPDHTYDWQRSCPARTVWLPPFYIDRYPVTNQEYDEFSELVLESDHLTCHPLEPDDKDHKRNTLYDSRVAADHPVTGVDWFDAYSFARWHGKQLPTEHQWEKAARGHHSTVWPWGDDWSSEACNWFGSAFETRSTPTLRAWRDLLATTSPSSPARTTRCSQAFEKYASSYGVVDCVGNCWEWTRTCLETHRGFSPSELERSDKPLSVVLKGGAWSSLPGQLFPAFRGQDAPYCRHNEIGFRCVKELPLPALRRMWKAPILNSAVY